MLSSLTSRKAAGGERRDPQRTRERLLQAAFQEIHRSGYRGTDLDTILRTAGITKGAMYHHFENKEALGYAVVDEIIAGLGQEKWWSPLKNAVNPIDALIGIIRSVSLKRSDVRCGCALNNLSQEMSPLDEGFRKRTAKLFWKWQSAIAECPAKWQKTRNGAQRYKSRRDGLFLDRYLRRLHLFGKESSKRHCSAGWPTNDDQLPRITSGAAWPNEIRTCSVSVISLTLFIYRLVGMSMTVTREEN